MAVNQPLFGNLFQSPQQVAAAKEQRLFEQARLASAGGMEQQLGMIGASAGTMAGAGIANLLGAEDPDLKKARTVQQIAMNIRKDLAPEQLANQEVVYSELSKRLMEAGYTGDAFQVAEQAAKARQQNIDNELRNRQLGFQERQLVISEKTLKENQYKNNPELLLEEARALPDDDPRKQTMINRYYDIKKEQAQKEARDKAELDRIKAETDRARAQAKAAGEDNQVGVAGPVGKAGAYRDVRGVVYGPAAMKGFRGEFGTLTKMIDLLNQVTPDDVKQAESWIDWTTTNKEIGGKVAGKTLNAQTKIAAAQLLEQINSLPPGAASDADMKAAAKSFPGYGNPEALARWVNNTKATAARYASELNDNFNFGKKIDVTPPIELRSGRGAAPAQGAGAGTMENPIILK